MSVGKLKNLIILVLVLANLVLLALVLPLRAEQQQQQELAMEQLRALFAEFGLTLDRQALPPTQVLYTLELTPDEDAALPAAKALLGEYVSVEDDSTRYLSLYRSNAGTCQAGRNGSLEAALSGYQSVTDPAAQVRTLLTAMGVEADSVSAPLRLEAGTYAVTAIQQLLDVPVFSSALRFTYRQNVLESVDGAALLDTTTLARIDDVACVGAADALVAFLGSRDQLGWLGAAVTEVTQGYLRAETASAAVVRLIPGWRVATDTGVFWVNGVTREVSALGT